MTAANDRVLDEIRKLASARVDALQDVWDDDVRPHVARLLTESATMTVRAAAGEDVTTARIALDASARNLAREQRARLELEARQLALQAALAVIGRLLAAA